MQRLVALLIALSAIAVLGAGCGAELTVRNVIDVPDPEVIPSPSNTPSAAILSGFGVSRGGEHYKIVQSLGGAMAKPVQDSADGTYNIKLHETNPVVEDDL